MRQGFPIATPGLRVGLLGGSFDPAHEGHIHISEYALSRFGLDRVWWLVSPGNPLKPHGPAPLDQRISFADELVQDPRIVVTGLETTLGTRMTVDTLRRLTALYPGVRFVWLMGSDNLAQFSQWDEWRAIADLVPIGVIARPGSRLSAKFSVAARVLARYRLPESRASALASTPPPAWVMIDVPLNYLSSSAIRAARRAKTARRRRKNAGATPE
ncbi:nicotinate-nucleotide adenylyltransferase [Paracoccus pacificus]|uniref:Probable nicotinate-nucleotide adenylyltransferase n=1 Tax=Paracoccus pacificus TaxID=1463598 RepID=A0ABW4R4Z9_9RHOB